MLNAKHNTDQCRDIVSRSTNDTNAVQPFAYMQKNMMDEMDKRRSEWEKEVERMAEDFFQVSLHGEILI